MNLNALLRGNRIGKATGLLALLGVFLVWWWLFGDPGSPVATRVVSGVITEVREKAYVVRLDSGQHVRVFRTVPAEVGVRVQLSVTKFESGEESYVLTETGTVAQ